MLRMGALHQAPRDKIFFLNKIKFFIFNFKLESIKKLLIKTKNYMSRRTKKWETQKEWALCLQS